MLKAVPQFPPTPSWRAQGELYPFFYLILNVANFVSEISKSTELYESVHRQYFGF